MKEILKKCDCLSEQNSIYFNNEKSHQSLISGIITIICYTLIFFFLIYFSIDVIKKKNPTSYFFKKYIPDVGTYYLNTSTIFHYIQLLDEDNNIRIDEDSFIMFGTEEYIDNFLKSFYLEDIDHYYYGFCNKNDILKNESIIDDENLLKSFCIRGFWNATLKKNFLTSDHNFIYPYLKYGSNSKYHKNIGYGIYIMKCQNISYRHNLCKKKEDIIEEYSKLLRIKFTLIDNNFDISIYKQPVVPYLLEITNHLTGNTITLNNLNFVPVNIISDDGNIFQANKTIESFRFDLNEKLSYDKSEENNIISSFYFIMGNKVEIYMRTYKKFQDALANIGGVSKALLMFSFVINYLINDYTINKDINIHYFAIKKEDYQKRKKNKNINYPTNNNNITNINFRNRKIDLKNQNLSYDSKDKSSEVNINDRFSNHKKLFNNFTIISTNKQNPQIQLASLNKDINKKNIFDDDSFIKRKKISFKIYFKSLFESKSVNSKKLILVRNIWKSKISEENIIFLSIQIESINKNLFNYNQFSILKNDDLLV